MIIVTRRERNKVKASCKNQVTVMKNLYFFPITYNILCILCSIGFNELLIYGMDLFMICIIDIAH